MVQKPKIQYVGQFYVHGSEARALEAEEAKKAKTSLPMAKLEAIEKIYIDPVALIGIAVAVVMLVVMAIGAFQLNEDWKVYEQMKEYVSDLSLKNRELDYIYRASYDLDDIKEKALAMGLISRKEVEIQTVKISLPEPETPALTWDQKIVRSWSELWA